jgi:hypothetical protein
MVHASPPSIRRLAGGGAPHQSPATLLTTVGPDKTGLPNPDHPVVSLHFVWQHKDETNDIRTVPVMRSRLISLLIGHWINYSSKKSLRH